MFSALCFDEKRNVLVLFGGVDDVMRSDTWEWDGKTWRQVLKGKSWKWDDGKEEYLVER